MTQQGDMTSQQPGPSRPGGSADVTAPAIASTGGPAGPTTAQPTAGQPTAGQPASTQPASTQPAGGQPTAEPAGPPGPATPYWPSPYLAEGQAVPEAYPAPARAGQPRYGEPAGSFQAAPQARFGRPGYGQPRAAAAQASVASPAAASQAAVPAAAADLPLAMAWERLLAMTMDWLLILGASFLLLHEQMTQLIDRFQAAMLAAQALGPDAQATALSNFEKDPATVRALISYFLMAFLMALVYFCALQANGGATLGKRVLGLRVVRADRSPAGLWASGVRTILFLIGPAILTFSSSIGYVSLAAVLSLLGAALWIADSLVLATDPQRRSLHDKLAGTIVVRKTPRRGTR
jgi:uncharacterized RDD family membrane protein YckC